MTFHWGKFWKCKMCLKHNYYGRLFLLTNLYFILVFESKYENNFDDPFSPGLCFFWNDLFVPKYPTSNPDPFVLTSMSVVGHLANNLGEGKQHMSLVTEVICHASYLTLFFSSHSLLVFHSNWLFWLVFEKKVTKNFSNSTKDILIFLNRKLAFCKTCTSRLMSLMPHRFARGKLILI